MKYESAAAGEEQISGGALNKISPYSFHNVKNKTIQKGMTKRKNTTGVVHPSNLII